MAIAFDVFAIVSENISVDGKLVGTYSANDRRAKKIVNWCYGQKQ